MDGGKVGAHVCVFVSGGDQILPLFEFLFCVTEFYVYLSTSGNAYIVCLIHAVYWEIFNNIRDSD